MLEKGLKCESVETVCDANTAVAAGSGDLPVFATPAMAALMENAAMMAVAGHLPAGSTTVGTEIGVSHVKASPVGARITASAELVEVDHSPEVDRNTESSLEHIGHALHAAAYACV
mgnify:CR=1 FL=1